MVCMWVATAFLFDIIPHEMQGFSPCEMHFGNDMPHKLRKVVAFLCE